VPGFARASTKNYENHRFSIFRDPQSSVCSPQSRKFSANLLRLFNLVYKLLNTINRTCYVFIFDN